MSGKYTYGFGALGQAIGVLLLGLNLTLITLSAGGHDVPNPATWSPLLLIFGICAYIMGTHAKDSAVIDARDKILKRRQDHVEQLENTPPGGCYKTGAEHIFIGAESTCLNGCGYKMETREPR